jgi:AraC family transcriptional regulator, transcriptional activator of pobA
MHGLMRDLTVDVLAAPLQVVVLEDAAFGSEVERGARAPHRHDYHELIWTRAGEGSHLVDGESVPVQPGTLTVIGRGQVHVFERARGVYGAVVRFSDEMLGSGPSWLVGARGALTVVVPPSSVLPLEAVVAILEAETDRPPDARSAGLQRHFLAGLLLWVERWYDAARVQRRESGDADVQLYRRFSALLERDFARHHDAAHYAEALAVPAAALSRALAAVTGRTTKQLVTDRVMLEAARLLRYTDLTVGEIAVRVGFDDQLYFSRAFKRHYGAAPMRYRDFHA